MRSFKKMFFHSKASESHTEAKKDTTNFKKETAAENNLFFEGNPFKILGLPTSASRDECKAAYRSLVLKYHPDRRPYGDAEKFKKITEAWNKIEDGECSQANPIVNRKVDEELEKFKKNVERAEAFSASLQEELVHIKEMAREYIDNIMFPVNNRIERCESAPELQKINQQEHNDVEKKRNSLPEFKFNR